MKTNSEKVKKVTVTIEIENQIESELLAAFMDAINGYSKLMKERDEREEDYRGVGGIFLIEEMETRSDLLFEVAQGLRQQLGFVEEDNEK